MPTYGIDLGTTYSCVAHIDDTGRPVVVKNAIGDDTTPSVVFFETPDNVVVGRDAKNSAKISPDLVVSLVKRRMGEKASNWSTTAPTHTPETVSALILSELARAADQNTDETVEDVVITVPAYFGVKAREATRNAGEIAGLNVIDVVPEPVAAALHYERAQRRRRPHHPGLRPRRRHVRHHGDPGAPRRRHSGLYRRRPPSRRRGLGREDRRLAAGQFMAEHPESDAA